MADFVWNKSKQMHSDERLTKIYKESIAPLDQLAIHFNEGTFSFIKQNDDFVYVLGHCYCPGESLEEVLESVLGSFSESRIAIVYGSDSMAKSFTEFM